MLLDTVSKSIYRYTIRLYIQSYHLTQILDKIEINKNTKLISFDISNMYTNIPIKETIEIINNKLKNNNFNKEYIKQITHILNTILKQNNFFRLIIFINKRTDWQWELLLLPSYQKYYLQKLDNKIKILLKTQILQIITIHKQITRS